MIEGRVEHAVETSRRESPCDRFQSGWVRNDPLYREHQRYRAEKHCKRLPQGSTATNERNQEAIRTEQKSRKRDVPQGRSHGSSADLVGEDFVFPETRLGETCAALPPRYACNMSAPSMRLFLWPDRLLFLGPGFEAEGHRHHAVQICVGLDEPLRLRASSRFCMATRGRSLHRARPAP